MDVYKEFDAKVRKEKEKRDVWAEWRRKQAPVLSPRPDSYYHRTAEFTHRQLRSLNFRRTLLRTRPNLKFDYADLNDETVDSFEYVGIPMAIYPKFNFHLVRNRSAKSFDRNATFVKRYGPEGSPPPLFLIMADYVRRQQYVELEGEALLTVQKKVNRFHCCLWGAEEDEEAEQIFEETIDEFKSRMADSWTQLLAFQRAAGLI